MTTRWRNIWWGIGGAIIVSYLLFSVVMSYRQRSVHSCNEVRIILEDSIERQFISPSSIVTLLKQKGVYPLGKDLDVVSSNEIESVILSNPVIQSAECYKTTSGMIKIHIRQRIPKFRVMLSEGGYYVDTEREVMPVLSGCASYVPVVSGRVGKTFASGELYDFIDYLEKDELWRHQITQLHITEFQEVILIPRIGNHRIELGKLIDYEQKMDKLRRLYVDGFQQLGWKSYTAIDLRYKGQVVCRR